MAPSVELLWEGGTVTLPPEGPAGWGLVRPHKYLKQPAEIDFDVMVTMPITSSDYYCSCSSRIVVNTSQAKINLNWVGD